MQEANGSHVVRGTITSISYYPGFLRPSNQSVEYISSTLLLFLLLMSLMGLNETTNSFIMKKTLFTMLVVAFTMTGCGFLDAVLGPTGSSTSGFSATGPVVRSCDPRIDVQLVSCKRFGSNVTLDYLITNNSFGNIGFFQMYTPLGHQKTSIYDNEGNHYKKVVLSLGTQQGYGTVDPPLMEGAPYKGSVTIENVSETATQISCLLYVFAVQSANKPALEHITFKNIPIAQ